MAQDVRQFPVESLVVAAGARDEDMRKLVVEYGLDTYAGALVAEVVSRCEPPAVPAPVPVALELHHDDQSVQHLLHVGPDGIGWEPTDAAGARAAAVRISVDLLVLTRSVFGPRCFDGAALRQVQVNLDAAAAAGPAGSRRMELAPGQLRMLDRPNPLAVAAQVVVAACASRPSDLGDLAIRFGTDKWGAWHWYTRHYDKHFAPLRYEPVRILEIGIGGYADPAAGGGSLRMWKNYFPRAIVYGMDIFDKSGVRESRIHTVQGSQDDVEFLTAFATQNGPFDIIIDDGSHLNAHVLTTFGALLPHVRPGGWYVIEDLQTAYWPQYGGTSSATAGAGTSIGLLKELIDGLEYQECNHPRGYTPSGSDQAVVGVHVYHNLAFIEVGHNAEATIPAWVRRAPVDFFYQPPAGDDNTPPTGRGQG